MEFLTAAIEFGKTTSIIMISICMILIIVGNVIKAFKPHSPWWITELGLWGIADFTSMYILLKMLEIIIELQA